MSASAVALHAPYSVHQNSKTPITLPFLHFRFTRALTLTLTVSLLWSVICLFEVYFLRFGFGIGIYLSLSLTFQISKATMSSSPKSKSESESLHLVEESNSDPVPSSPKVNNDNVAKKTTLIVQCEVVRRRSPRLSPSPSQGFRRSARLSSDGGKSEKPPPPPPRRRSSTSTSTSRFASPPQNARSTDHFKVCYCYSLNKIIVTPFLIYWFLSMV